MHDLSLKCNCLHSPGTMATVLRARRTRNVLNAAKFPTGNAIVMYLRNHGSTCFMLLAYTNKDLYDNVADTVTVKA